MELSYEDIPPVAVTPVTYEELKVLTKAAQKDVLIIDVRERDEIAELGSIPFSHNLPLSELYAALDLPEQRFFRAYGFSKPGEGTAIILTCRSGRRSGLALDAMIKAGYSNIRNYKGSWNEWSEREAAALVQSNLK